MTSRSAFLAILVTYAAVGPALGQGFEPLTPGAGPPAVSQAGAAAAGIALAPSTGAPSSSIFVPTPSAQALAPPNVFRDPNGNFTAPVPAGWAANLPGDGSVQMVQGGAWVVLATVASMQPQAGAKVVIDQMSAPYKLIQTNAATATVGGHPVYYAVFTGQSQQQGPVAMMIAGIQAPSGHVLAFISSAPLQTINDVSPAFLQIMQGIRFAGE